MGFDANVVREVAAKGFEHRRRVLPEWIDYNGHMNVAYYLVAFDTGFDTFVDTLDFGEAARKATNMTTMTLEGHV
ncbi:MAG: thioesterase family protein, partial [Alphaproteobacteria bacterium]